ncbi:MAG: hypothetical protein ACRD50_12660 [Candidatus Acidiferrales bacterium]
MTNHKISRVEVYWHTVSYRTVILLIFLAISLGLGVAWFFSPGTLSRVLTRIGEAIAPKTASLTGASLRQVRFVNLDGKVQVKQVNSVQWAVADYQMALDKGDLIQTGADGVARIAFADGTTYTVKGDTLVTVEENLVVQDRASRVGMHINSGAVDLATGAWEVPGSKADVTFENAVASLRSNSKAAVSTDPYQNESQITVSSGSADLQRGTEQVQLNQWQKAEFRNGGPIVRSEVLAPPRLLEPVNLQPIIVADPKHTTIRFSWEPVSTAVEYDLQVSASAMFTGVLTEKKTNTTSAEITGLDAGDYFWTVKAYDAKKNISPGIDFYKFSLVAQSKAQEMLLEVDSTELHGSVVEISGRTEPGAALIVNGQQVADIQPDGKFRYFTEPLARGSHTIVITGQNRRGGTAIKRVEIVIP